MPDAERISEFKANWPGHAEVVEMLIAQATLPPARDVRREIALETAVRISVTGDTAEALISKADKIYEWLAKQV